MFWVFAILAFTTILVLSYAISLQKKLNGWCSPENYNSAVELERKRLNDLYSSYFLRWKIDEISGIREQERQAAHRLALVGQTEWKLQEEGRIRADAINRSQAVTKGKITEHLVPFFPQFDYNSKDARFLGSPIDLIVFNRLSEGSLEEIVFIEVKTGESQLTTRERQVRNCIKAGNIRWEELRA